MSKQFRSDPQQIPPLIKRCADHVLVELILMDRPATAEKKYYQAGEYDLYHGLYNAAIQELLRRYAAQTAQKQAGEKEL